MKKTLLLIGAMVVSLNVFAQTNELKIAKPSISLEAGYVDRLFSKGVSYTSTALQYLGLNLASPAENNFIPVDIYGGGLLLTENTDSFWTVGLGKDIKLGGSDKYKLRIDTAYATRKTDLDEPANNEVSGTIALVNPLLTPYIGYTRDWKIEQNGFTLGVKRDFTVSDWLTISPNAAYHTFDDYESIELSTRLSVTKWRQLTPFIEGRYVDNNFDKASFNWASYEASGDTTWLAGLSLNF